MAAQKKPYRIVCIKDNFSNNILWHEGDVATSADVSASSLERHWQKLGGTSEDLLEKVEKEKAPEKKPEKKTEDKE